MKREFSGLSIDITQAHDEKYLTVRLSESELQALSEIALTQNITALRNRIDELGVAEPVVQRQGDRRIVIQLPGVQDTARAKRNLGRTATLEMMLVDEEHSLEAAQNGKTPPGSRLYKMRDGRSILLKKRVIYSGEKYCRCSGQYRYPKWEPHRQHHT